MTIAPARRMPLLIVLMCLLSAGGCALFETPEPDEAPQPAPVPAARETQSQPADLPTAMEYLESGRGDEARQVLAELAEEAPGSTIVAGLLRQIDVPPEKLLPGPYRQVEVGPGESLSLIAARELGDPMMFYALARLNGIDVPARIPVGTLLRVPAHAEPDAEPAPAEIAEAPAEISAREIESVAEYLARSGQEQQARDMLADKLAEGDGADSTRELLAGLTLAHAGELRAAAEYDRAIGAIDQALAVIGTADQRSDLIAERQRIQSQYLRDIALRLREEGKLVAAYQTARRAAGFGSASDNVAALADDLRAELVESLHNEALLAWRDRNVDLAIRTWESLLAVVPDFEPARVYLERARLLRKRLDEP